MATGSYEESLPMEGIPDHTSLCPSRGRGDGGLGSSFPPRATREGERLHGRKKGKRQGGQRFDREAPWEDNAHVRSPAKKPEPEPTKAAPTPIRRSGLGRRETPGPPVKPRRAQTLRGAHAAKAAEANPGTHEVRVHAVSSQGGRSRSDTSRVLPTGRSKASWWMRKQAGR
jgi:hypothetical protein